MYRERLNKIVIIDSFFFTNPLRKVGKGRVNLRQTNKTNKLDQKTDSWRARAQNKPRCFGAGHERNFVKTS